MAKVYIIKDSDLESLLNSLKHDPGHDKTLNDQDREVYDHTFHFYNYHVCKWIDQVKKGDRD